MTIQPHFRVQPQPHEAEVAEGPGKSGWAARRAKQRLFQHTSVTVTVANGNVRIPGRHDLACQCQWRAPGAHGPNPEHHH